MKIATATDAWFPQVNGVIRTLAATVAELDRRGHEVELITRTVDRKAAAVFARRFTWEGATDQFLAALAAAAQTGAADPAAFHAVPA